MPCEIDLTDNIGTCNEVNFTNKQKKLRLVQAEGSCRAQNNCYSKIGLCFGSVENIVSRGQNAGNQHFLLSHDVFKSFSFSHLVRI